MDSALDNAGKAKIMNKCLGCIRKNDDFTIRIKRFLNWNMIVYVNNCVLTNLDSLQPEIPFVHVCGGWRWSRESTVAAGPPPPSWGQLDAQVVSPCTRVTNSDGRTAPPPPPKKKS